MSNGANHVERFAHEGATLVDEVIELAHPGTSADQHIVFLHGWGGSRDSLRGIATLFQNEYCVHLMDLPGFGEAPPPPPDWGTLHYTDLVQQYLIDRVHGSVILVGHSFGARVSLRLASRRLAQIRALVLMSAPGLPPEGATIHVRRWGIRTLRKILMGVQGITGRGPVEWHTKRFGSKDYLAAGELRPVLVRTVNENLTESAQAVACPVLLVYGSDDTETPPWLAARYAALMKEHAVVAMLPHKDHHLYTGTGAHLCAYKIRQWLGQAGQAGVGRRPELQLGRRTGRVP